MLLKKIIINNKHAGIHYFDLNLVENLKTICKSKRKKNLIQIQLEWTGKEKMNGAGEKERNVQRMIDA